MAHATDFRRMILSLPRDRADYRSVAFTGALAERLGLDLVGVFEQDGHLDDLAALPSVREFRLHSREWHQIERAQLDNMLKRGITDARRQFEETVKALRIGTRFNSVKGPLANTLSAESTAADIVAVIEPRNPAERITYQFGRVVDMALSAAGSTLLVPSHIQHDQGPVVAIVSHEGDASLQAATTVAKASGERLLVLKAPGVDQRLIARTENGNVPISQRSLNAGTLDVSELNSLLAGVGESFVVINRDLDARLPRLAFDRCVPTLVVGGE